MPLIYTLQNIGYYILLGCELLLATGVAAVSAPAAVAVATIAAAQHTCSEMSQATNVAADAPALHKLASHVTEAVTFGLVSSCTPFSQITNTRVGTIGWILLQSVCM